MAAAGPDANRHDDVNGLPLDALRLIVACLDARSLHAASLIGRGAAIARAARDDAAWELHCLRDFPEHMPVRNSAHRHYLTCRERVHGPRYRLRACARGQLPFLSSLGGAHAQSLPTTLSFGIVCDIVKLHECSESKYRAAAAWIGRRTADGPDEKRLSAALREAYQCVFPPSGTASKADRNARTRSSAGKQIKGPMLVDMGEPGQREAELAGLLDQPAVRTCVDSYGRFLVAPIREPRWLRHHATTF